MKNYLCWSSWYSPRAVYIWTFGQTSHRTCLYNNRLLLKDIDCQTASTKICDECLVLLIFLDVGYLAIYESMYINFLLLFKLKYGGDLYPKTDAVKAAGWWWSEDFVWWLNSRMFFTVCKTYHSTFHKYLHVESM